MKNEKCKMKNGPAGVSRRQFLVHSLQTSAALVAATAVAAEPTGTSSQPKIRFGFTTYQWGKDWDLPTLIANCAKTRALGVELRTSAGYAHGVELDISDQRCAEVKKMFADSPVTLLGLATSEKFDWPDQQKLKAAIESAKAFLKLSHKLGASGIRVFPNDFPKGVPHEKTIEQIAAAMNQIGPVAAELGQQVRLESHGSAGDLVTLRAIMDRVTSPAVRLKLNSMERDSAGEGFEHNFNLVKPFLGSTVHMHDMRDPKFPNQLQIDLLVKMGWSGWMLLEASDKVPDRVQALDEQRQLWEAMYAKACNR